MYRQQSPEETHENTPQTVRPMSQMNKHACIHSYVILDNKPIYEMECQYSDNNNKKNMNSMS